MLALDHSGHERWGRARAPGHRARSCVGPPDDSDVHKGAGTTATCPTCEAVHVSTTVIQRIRGVHATQGVDVDGCSGLLQDTSNLIYHTSEDSCDEDSLVHTLNFRGF
ncbi:unnamed protein product [Urochloa humidicola]